MPIATLNNFWTYLGLTDQTAIEFLSGLSVVGICLIAIAFSRFVVRRFF